MFALKTFTPEESLAETLGDWHWRNFLPQENSLRVSYGNSIFVAVGDSGAILTSPDGANWAVETSGASAHLEGIVYGKNSGRFLL
jgi:hypothetical protein